MTKDQIDAVQQSHSAYLGMLALGEEANKVADKAPDLNLPRPTGSMMQSTRARIKWLEEKHGKVLP